MTVTENSGNMIRKTWFIVLSIALSVKTGATQDDIPANDTSHVVLQPLDLGGAGAGIPDLSGAEYPLTDGNQPLQPARGPLDDYLNAEPDYKEFENYDYAYYDYGVDYPEPPPDIDVNGTIESSFIRKCRCGAHQVLLDNNTCIDYKTRTPVIHPWSRRPSFFNTTHFQFVAVKELECKDGYFLNQLSLGHLFMIEANGYLLLLDGYERQLSQDDYCIEHTLHDEESIILHDVDNLNWKASVCVPKPVLPTCCGEGEVLAPGSDTCTPFEGALSFNFTPPINYTEGVLKHEHLGNQSYHDIGCSGKSVKEVRLSELTAALHYFFDRPPGLLFVNDYMLSEQALEYCLAARQKEEGSLEMEYVARFCYHDVCKNSTCVRKCCLNGEHLENGTCIDNYDPYTNLNYTFYRNDSKTVIADPPPKKHEYHGLLVQCTPENGLGVVELDPKKNSEDTYYLLDDGRLYLPLYRKGGVCGEAEDSYYFIDKYCMDSYIDESGKYSEVVMFCHEEHKEVIGCEAYAVLYPILMGISCVFLVLTLIVYLGVTSLRERTYGRCLCSLVISILIVYITFICNYAGILQSNASCYAVAFIGHFSSLSMFFWLSVMGFDMWSTLRSSKPQNQSKKLFARYSLYAWGFPLLFAVIALIIKLLPETEEYCHIIRPDFVNGGRACSFNSLETRWIYQYWVILLLTCVNLIFFVHVTITLIQTHKQTKKVLQSPNSSRQSNVIEQKKKSRMWLYIKLFLVMGITWIIEVVSFKDCGWIVGDSFNLLQGLLIFIITVCKKDVFKKIQDAWGLQDLGDGISTFRDRMTRSVGGRSSAEHRNGGLLGCCRQRWSLVETEDPSEQHWKPIESIKLNDTHTQQ